MKIIYTESEKERIIEGFIEDFCPFEWEYHSDKCKDLCEERIIKNIEWVIEDDKKL